MNDVWMRSYGPLRGRDDALAMALVVVRRTRRRGASAVLSLLTFTVARSLPMAFTCAASEVAAAPSTKLAADYRHRSNT